MDTKASPIRAEGCSSRSIIIQFSNGEHHRVTINSAHTVDDLKSYLSEVTVCAAEDQTLTYNGLKMEYGRVLLCYYGVEDGETIRLLKPAQELLVDVASQFDLDEFVRDDRGSLEREDTPVLPADAVSAFSPNDATLDHMGGLEQRNSSDKDAATISITVIFLTGEKHAVTIRATHTVDDLKQYLAGLTPWTADELRPIYAGKQLEDGRLLTFTREQFLTTGLVPVLSKAPSTYGECPICYEDSLTDPIKTPCGHIFDRACLTQWLSGDKKNTCPMCKTLLFELSEAETLGPAEVRRRQAAEALHTSNLISREPPFYNYGSTEWNVSSLHRATAQATNTLANQQRVPGAGMMVEIEGGPAPALAHVSGPCYIDPQALSAPFIAMANLLPAFRTVLGSPFSPAEIEAWRNICPALWSVIQTFKGKKADAMILARVLKEKTLTSLINARKAEISAAERGFIGAAGRNVEVLNTLLDYLVFRAWMQERDAQERQTRRRETERMRRENREDWKMNVETKCAVM